MSDSEEEFYAGDDSLYEIIVATDNKGSSDEPNLTEDDVDNESRETMESEPNLSIEDDRTIGNGLHLSECETQQCIVGHPDSANVIPQMLVNDFATEEEADMCYREYARTVGFGIQKHNKRRNVKGNIIGRTWVCSRQGFRPAKDMEKRNRMRELRPVTRTGCRAQFRVIYNPETQRWACSYFHGVHNHNLTPPQLVHHIRSHRRVTGPDLYAASSLQRVGVKPSQIHEFIVDRLGGYDKVGYTRRDVQNTLQLNRRAELKESDAEMCLSYLEGRKSLDPSFFYDYTVIGSNQLEDLFWCDGGSCANYELFGDVIAFDATNKTNAYRKPFVVILGINHHRRTIVFGFALLSNETEHTYTWLLETFMMAMNNKHPKAVITDGDKAMRNAISNTFPEASHKLCCWHVARNAQTNVNNTEFNRDFQRCMLNAYTEEEFDRKWNVLVDKHNVRTNEWVVKMYDDRHIWAEMGRLMDRQREREGKDDFDSSDGQPVLVTHLKMYEQQAAEKFTRAMYRLVRQEIDKKGLLTAEMCHRDTMTTIFRVRRFGVSGKEVKVSINEATKTLSCSCKCLETIGIPCSHSFVVLKAQNMTEIPRSMILSRWTKDAKITAHALSDISLSKSHYMTEQARIGQIYSACRSLLRYAASSVAAYNVAITNIHHLTLTLEAMCQKKQPTTERSQRRRNMVEDPEVVLTKGFVKRSKTRQPQQQKCCRCGTAGHNVRKCEKVKRTNQLLDDCSSQCMEIFFDSNVLGANALDTAMPPTTLKQPTQHRNVLSSQQEKHNAQTFENTYDSWVHRLSGSTDSESTNPTFNTGAYEPLSNYIAVSSSAPTNYADLWNL